MRELANLAQTQLAAWEAVAKKWVMIPSHLVTEEGHRLGRGIWQIHYLCGGLDNRRNDPPPYGPCGQSVMTIDNGYGSFHTSPGLILAAVTAHIRNVHRDIEEMVYADDKPLR